MTSLHVATVSSVAALGRAAWDAIAVSASDAPFLHWGFLSALEDSGVTTPATGWTPCHLVATLTSSNIPSQIVGIAPAFIKMHSFGEFIFDFAWADAARAIGIPYYPKLVLAAPLTPVAGPRLLVAPDLPPPLAATVRRALLAAAVAHAEDAGLSGVHLLFCTPTELALAQDLSFIPRTSYQFHWQNHAYRDFDAFLARFPSKRRNQIRRERAQLRAAGVTVETLRGPTLTSAWVDPALACYRATVDRYVWGRRTLNRATLQLLFERLHPYLEFTVARRGDTLLGGALNFQNAPTPSSPTRRFGRYWGALTEVPNLHFETCAYHPIATAIAEGLPTFEAGAGGDHHKLTRGFLPAETHSAHLILNPTLRASIRRFCAAEARTLHEEAAALAASVFIR